MTNRIRLVLGLSLASMSFATLVACDHHADFATRTDDDDDAWGAAGYGEAGKAGGGGQAGAPIWSVDPVCSDEEYQVYQNGCGLGNSLSTCVELPTHCFDTYNPVCACDGLVYDNMCEANLAGYGLNDAIEEVNATTLQGPCTPPSGYISCGSGFCASGTSYCARLDNGWHVTGYECKTLPPACADDPTCACLSSLGSFCVDEVGGGAMLMNAIE